MLQRADEFVEFREDPLDFGLGRRCGGFDPRRVELDAFCLDAGVRNSGVEVLKVEDDLPRLDGDVNRFNGDLRTSEAGAKRVNSDPNCFGVDPICSDIEPFCSDVDPFCFDFEPICFDPDPPSCFLSAICENFVQNDRFSQAAAG